ncbi:MAG TPA: hypothetical protein PKA06_08450 [Gemmatales bacterium]|nr:hypothetical protein [Gemmatales bacterium]HMP15556.1 hypothetical protein [Gemmatales bacterium]
MKWYTLLHGILLLALGLVARYLWQILQWQALIPIVMGLGYITFAEGMRSKPQSQRLFLFLSCLWSVLILVVSLPLAQHLAGVWRNQPVELEGIPIRSELIIEHTVVVVLTIIFFLLAVRTLLRTSSQAGSA